jgi:phosphate-selective porin OprO/OprP
MTVRSLLLAGTIVGISGLASQAFAQNAPSTQASIRAQQAEIDYLKQQLKAMQDKLESLQTQSTTQAQAVATTQAQVAETVAKPKPHVTESASHRMALESADGLYSIGLTGRVNLDVGDYVGFTPKSREVGPQDLNSGFNARRARIGITGKADGDFGYTFIYDAGGSNDSAQGVIETAQLTYTGLKGANFNTSFEFGYSDTFFTLEEAQGSNDITFMERSAPQVAAVSVNAGDNRSNVGGRFYNDRLWIGAYVTGPANGNAHGVGESIGAFERVAYQFLSTPDYSLHIGGDFDEIIKAPQAAAGAANGFAISSTPELRVDPTTFATTGAAGTAYGTLGAIVSGVNHSVSGGYIADAELAGTYGPLLLQSEYYHFDIDRIGLKTAAFDGEYAQVAYTLTGEAHKYNKAAGAYVSPVPAYDFAPSQGHWGAFEIAARYSYIDLTSNFTAGLPISATSQPSAINGGKETGYTVGLNWYPNTYMRVMLNYIHTDFEKANPAAVTVAGVGTAAIGTPVGATIDAIALRTQVNW